MLWVLRMGQTSRRTLRRPGSGRSIATLRTWALLADGLDRRAGREHVHGAVAQLRIGHARAWLGNATAKMVGRDEGLHGMRPSKPRAGPRLRWAHAVQRLVATDHLGDGVAEL